MTRLKKSRLRKSDKKIYRLCKKEIRHQNSILSLNANDNIVSKAVLEAGTNVFVNCYPETYKKIKYLRRTKLHDRVERIANRRALRLFRLDGNKWGVNLRPVSGTSANLVAFLALCGLNGKILALAEEFGGHHSFNFRGNEIQTLFQEKLFETHSFKIKPDGEIDYDEIQRKALEIKPKIIIAGSYAVSMNFDFEKMKQIATESGSILLGDIAHPAGLIAHGKIPNPFDHCDVVTGVFHKTISGPRAGFIFFKKEYKQKIMDTSTIICGNAHTHIIVQQAVALKEANRSYKRKLSQRTLKYAQTLRQLLHNKKFTVYKTECHMVLIDLQCPVRSYVFEILADFLKISLNRICLASNPDYLHPTGIRIGLSGYTKRKIPEEYLPEIANILARIREMSEELITKQNLTEKNMDSMSISRSFFLKLKNLRAEIVKIVKYSPIKYIKS